MPYGVRGNVLNNFGNSPSIRFSTRLTSFSSDADKDHQLEIMHKIFSVLPDKLPYITAYKTGRNICIDGNSCDFVIDSLFNSRADLRAYQESPEHAEAIMHASAIRKEKAVVDYEY